MEFKHLETLKAIIEEGSYIAASEKLGYTQSSVTQHIQQLEESLGIRLFDKIGRKMVLSEAGRRVMPYVDELIQTADKIRNIDKDDTELTGELSVACFESLLEYRLVKVIERFCAAAPKVKLIIYAYNSEMIRSSVLGGKCDLGLLFCEDKLLNGLGYNKLNTYPIVLVASKNADTSHICPDIRGSDLGARLITSEPDGVYRKVFQDYLRSNNIKTGNLLELWSITAIKKCVSEGMGITYLPQYSIEQELQDGRMKIIPCSCNEQTVQTTCIFNKNRWVSRQSELFMRLLSEENV